MGDKKNVSPNRRSAEEKTTTNFTWQGAEYTRVDPGVYSAVCKVVLGPDWVRMYRRWVVKIIFTLLSEEGEGGDVPLFLNLGNDEKSPSIARNSDYRKWWTAANGALPSHGEAMTPDVFLQNQLFQIQVVDSILDRNQKSKTANAIYSKVAGLVDVHLTGNSSGSRSPSSSRSPEHDSEEEEERLSSTSSSGSRSPLQRHPIKRGISREKTGSGPKPTGKNTFSASPTTFSASPSPGDGTHLPKNATQKSGGFGSRSGKTTMTIQ